MTGRSSRRWSARAGGGGAGRGLGVALEHCVVRIWVGDKKLPRDGGCATSERTATYAPPHFDPLDQESTDVELAHILCSILGLNVGHVN
jgi:hypothetical protein